MKTCNAFALLLLIAVVAFPHLVEAKTRGRRLSKGSDKKGDKKDKKDKKDMEMDEKMPQKLTLRVINDAFKQPFSPFFVMVHNREAERLYIRGQSASDPLKILAENGNPMPLVQYFRGAGGVQTAFQAGDAPFTGSLDIEVEVSYEYPLVTIASMAVNTNDCFVAINGMKLSKGMVVSGDGLDAGTEENNQLCDSIPGPVCGGANLISDNKGEGKVHVHRGIHNGIGDLSDAQVGEVAWLNPMMRVVVM